MCKRMNNKFETSSGVGGAPADGHDSGPDCGPNTNTTALEDYCSETLSAVT